MLNSSITSSDVPQRKTVMISSEDRHGIRPTGYPLSSSTSQDRRNYAVFFAAFNTSKTMNILPRSFSCLHFLPSKQPPNHKQTIACSKLPSLQDNIDHNTIQPCHGNLCKTCQIIDMGTTITHGNTIYH
eukprot:g18350.t1